jgi:hypothetical protein
MGRCIVADFLERVRRYSFFVTMLAGIYLGYLVIDGYIVIYLGHYRGEYNSAWVGTLVALSSAVFISVVGFYIVKNAINRDRQTRVGQIIAATPVGKLTYLLSKTISNFLVLSAMVGIQIGAAMIMLLLNPDGPEFEFWKLLSPFILITFPALIFVAALAVFFESVKVLSGGLGNVVYFFLIEAMLVVPLVGGVKDFDHLFIREIEASMHESARAAYPEFDGGFTLGARPRDSQLSREELKLFSWEGISWTPVMVARRLSWYIFAFLVTLLAVPFFDRFDDATIQKITRKRKESGAGGRMAGLISALTRINLSSRFGRLLIAELRLMLKGLHWAWFLVALGFIVAGFFAPTAAVREGLLAFTWIWPILVWSKMGMREAYYGTGQLIFTAPGIRLRQLVASWGAGIAITLMTGLGAGVNLLAAGEFQSLAAFGAAVLFVPALALAMGAVSGGSKLFEATYVFWWYIGPMNRIPAVDFTGMASGPAASAGYALLSVTLVGIAYVSRRRVLHTAPG